ncbi:CarD family transcriptional regulator [Mycetocola spongiae]|uniref:CarD family transcriptional regulator n=1 Tax=Mycetocola spongiae TaxID=2859226 RepID=UPI001CF4442B|nr:CarD family transcriptional regulator [Mycetocola spongiae]UCR90227.1 CarD family transcriptional regulator [Mycetocola spongiae]
MNYTVGHTLVYPHHGAVTISAVAERVIKGETKTYLTLRVHTTELEIQVPVDNLEQVGVREVIDEAGVQEVYGVLREEVIEEPGNWSRRFKANQEKMASGSVQRIAEVVRDLWRRDTEKGVSPGEKRMLQKATEVLASELALARATGVEEATVELEAVLAAAPAAPVAS